MRNILFRGKQVDTGEWIEGYYAKQSNHSCFASQLKYQHFIFVDVCMDISLGGLIKFEVVPETIGQYTGLTDKNGKKIFEGDVIKCISRFDAKDMVVIFEKAEFHLVDCQRYKNYTECCGYRYFGTLETEVIGNIHDNSELLKGSEW